MLRAFALAMTKNTSEQNGLKNTQKTTNTINKNSLYIQSEFKNGEGGIRTRGGVAPTQTFQVCTLNHSDTSPMTLVLKELLLFYLHNT